jgi:hypothetical protein
LFFRGLSSEKSENTAAVELNNVTVLQYYELIEYSSHFIDAKREERQLNRAATKGAISQILKFPD